MPSRRVLKTAAHPIVKAWASTWREQVIRGQYWDVSRASGTATVFLFWHEVLLPLLWHHRDQDLAAVTSDSRDGQYVADLGVSLGYRIIRGSSSKGATRVLLAAVRTLQEGGSVAFSPDGPRGPRQTMKPGAMAAAQRANASIIPVHAAADRGWRLNSWDRFLIPKPFSRVRIFYGEPFTVGAGEEGLAAATATAERAMAELVKEAHGTTTP